MDVLPSNDGRINLQLIRNKLNIVLEKSSGREDGVQLYWSCFKRFAQAKLTKPEMDSTALSLLKTSENIALHNLFVKAIINNIQSPYSGPLSIRRGTTAYNQIVASESSTKSVRKSTKDARKPTEEKIETTTTTKSTEPMEEIVNTTPICEHLALTHRTNLIAAQASLCHVHPEAIQYLDMCIRKYLTQILSEASPSATIMREDLKRKDGSLEQFKMFTVEDIIEAIENKPELSPVDTQVLLDKISMALALYKL
ncbi:hypothetical protein PROFUN_09156 [Planoprotostelium fungivorum]|uniref:Uncharacterized protein n=1 Tax=Planoprotostelium fungivorum TaxID=1890364 RepID=A0A2P6MVJ5_9EUKA|nr:hypothetical protein PROFUN_09156 [Planoprotostelium fungivorum]